MTKKIPNFNDAEIFTQKRYGGWNGFDVYVRHPVFSKFSFVVLSEKEPELTDDFKRMAFDLAIKNKRVEDHNYPLYFEREKFDYNYRDCQEDIGRLIWNDEDRKTIIDALMKECEYPAVNQLLQRILDMQSSKESIREIESRKLPSVDRKIKL